MHYELSLAHLSLLNTDPVNLIKIAGKVGYRYVGLRLTQVTKTENSYPLVTDRGLLQDTLSALDDYGVGVNDVELIQLGPTTDPTTFRPFLATASALGAKGVIAQLPDPDRARAADHFGELCELAAVFGLNVDLEFTSWSETPDVREAGRILSAVNMPNAGILVDTLHFSRSASTLADLQAVPRSCFHFMHLCDAPGEIPASLHDILHTARAARLIPGQGELNLKEIVESMPPMIYATEIPNDQLVQALGAEEYARQIFAGSIQLLRNCRII